MQQSSRSSFLLSLSLLITGRLCFFSMRPTCFCASATRTIPTILSSQCFYASWNIIKESCSLPRTESGVLMMRSGAGSTLRFGIVLWVLTRERGSGTPFFKMQSRPKGKQTTVARSLTTLQGTILEWQIGDSMVQLRCCDHWLHEDCLSKSVLDGRCPTCRIWLASLDDALVLAGAASAGDVLKVKELLEKHTPCTAQDYYGRTALHLAPMESTHPPLISRGGRHYTLLHRATLWAFSDSSWKEGRIWPLEMAKV
jgi:hypothetical protein